MTALSWIVILSGLFLYGLETAGAAGGELEHPGMVASVSASCVWVIVVIVVIADSTTVLSFSQILGKYRPMLFR